MDITGKLYKLFEAQQVTDRFRKREFVLTTEADTRYPQQVMFQLTGNRCEMLDGFGEGDEVTVEFSLRGREWTSPKGDVKYFNSLEVWKLEKIGAGKSAGPASEEEPPLPDGPPGYLETEDDVPF